MIVIAGLVLGAVLGARTALKRGGRRLDALEVRLGARLFERARLVNQTLRNSSAVLANRDHH